MEKTKKKSSRLFHILSGIFLGVSAAALFTLSFFVQYQDLKETYLSAEETVSFLKTECQKYDNYMEGNSARSLQDLLDTAKGIEQFISFSKAADSRFLEDFIRTEHVGGILLLDAGFSPVAQADMDHQDSFALWEEVLQKDTIRDMLVYPQKSYVDRVTLGGVPYDFAAIAKEDGSGLILCYSSTRKPGSDPYELSISSILKNNNFHKNPTVVIADGSQILSTNDSLVEELGAGEYQELVSSIVWKDNQFSRFKYDGRVWYGLRRIYGNYYVYAVYQPEEIFSNRTDFIADSFMLYLSMCLVLLVIQRRSDRVNLRRMEKQLRIINAISTSYTSTFILHIDRMELEPLNPSKRLKAVFEEHPDPEDFLVSACKNDIAPEYRTELMKFLDIETLAERVKGYPYLGKEIRDTVGGWYSVLVIPQRLDESGNVQAVLVTTRDVTDIKRTEELSFKDKLTGLYNRNYMESRSRRFVRAGDFPVSLIMADCNYLKRTNDTLGHEYGDLLLRRVAETIRETIPKGSIAMRVGGDEFLILCTGCTEDGAERLIEMLREKLKEKSDDALSLDVAFGAYTVENGNEFSFEEAYDRADRAMYRDKETSRRGR